MKKSIVFSFKPFFPSFSSKDVSDYMCIINFRLSATATAAVTAVIIVVTATAAITATVTVAAQRYQKKYDDEKPDNIVIIENIAKTIHKKYPPFAVYDGGFIKV